MSRYTPLLAHLDSLCEDTIRLSFEELDGMLDSPLPASARRHAPYWSIHNHVGRILSAAGWQASPKFSTGYVEFARSQAGTVATATRESMPRVTNHGSVNESPAAIAPDLILIGCVKSKQSGRHPARSLYTSALFRGRREHAESTGCPWYILSAKHGLVSPADEIDSYELQLSAISVRERRDWSRDVLETLTKRVGQLQGKCVEIHAGASYRNSGLVDGLRTLGASVNVPTERLSFGQHLAWYAARSSNEPVEPKIDAKNGLSAFHKVADDRRIRQVVDLLTRDFAEGSLDLILRAGAPDSGWNTLPGFVAARSLRRAGASDRQVRMFITLVAAMDRAREANRLWRVALQMWHSAPWTFDARQVINRSLTELRATLAASGVSQRHLADSASWRLICEALVNADSPASVRAAIEEGRGNAAVLLRDVGAQKAAGQSWYPFLSGPKVSAMWIRMLIAPGGAEVSGADAIPVAVDVQVRKVSEYLGVCSTAGLSLNEARPRIQNAWRTGAAAAHGPDAIAGTSAAIDPAIWFFGKWGCTFCERTGKRPISAVCESCLFGA